MPKWNMRKRQSSRYCEGNAPFSHFFQRDLRRSLTDLRASPRARAKFHPGLVCGKLADLSPDHGRSGLVYYHRTLGYHQ